MFRIFGSPTRYVQGPGAIDQIGELTRRLTQRPLVIVDAEVLQFVEGALEAGFADRDALVLPFSGEITVPVIEALKDTATGHRSDLVIGIGGGKGLDAAKGVARRLDLPFASVPTIASNDSPTGCAVAIYDENHVLVAVETIPENPALVLVDTQLIANAPAKFLCAGMGDALAKKFEAERAHADGALNFFGTRPLLTPLAIADCCYRTLREHGVAAMAAAQRHEVTDAFEAVVEANILMSGLGYESSGLSYAHAVVRGLVKARGAAGAAHGMHVGYATLVQLAIEDRDDDFILDVLEFNRAVGLPIRLADMGMDNPTDAEIAEIGRLTSIGPEGSKIVISVPASTITAAIGRVEALAGAGAPA